MQKLLNKGKNFFFSEQSSIFSAAAIIMSMNVLSLVFSVVRQWVILRYLGSDNYSLFAAAFRLPDIVFEVFAFGVFSAAFIPVFSKYLKKGQKEAWEVAGRVINIGLIIFGIFAFLFSLFSYQFYSIVALGFDAEQTRQVADIAKILFAAQGFFIVSYIATGVLESLRRFLVPAMAPLFYNLGIILGTVLFFDRFGIFAPALGAVIGAIMHLGIQLPFAYRFGFRFSRHIKPNEGVREIGKLATPRFLELLSLQVLKSAELFFATLISTASYGFLALANSLQQAPTVLFGVSFSKVALVSLSRADSEENFKKIFVNTLNQIMFFILPIATLLMVMRIPIVRLIYGTSQSLDWNSTVEVGLALSAFAFGVPFQSALALLSRAFYARHNTKVPVIISLLDIVLTLIIEIVLVLVLKLPVWSIALANTLSCIVQVTALFIILGRSLGGRHFFSFRPLGKVLFATSISGSAMFFILKFFDRSVWIKRLAFFSSSDVFSNLQFQKFVLDTRYTFNLIALTAMVSGIGMLIYVAILYLLKSKELFIVLDTLKKKRLSLLGRSSEPISQPTE